MTELVIITAVAFNRDGEHATTSRIYDLARDDDDAAELSAVVSEEAKREFDNDYYDLVGVHVTKTRIFVGDVPIIETEAPAAHFTTDIKTC